MNVVSYKSLPAYIYRVSFKIVMKQKHIYYNLIYSFLISMPKCWNEKHVEEVFKILIKLISITFMILNKFHFLETIFR